MKGDFSAYHTAVYGCAFHIRWGVSVGGAAAIMGRFQPQSWALAWLSWIALFALRMGRCFRFSRRTGASLGS